MRDTVVFSTMPRKFFIVLCQIRRVHPAAAAKMPRPRGSAKKFFPAAAETAHAKFAKRAKPAAVRRAHHFAAESPKNRVPPRNSGIFRPGAGGGRGRVKSASRAGFA